MKRINFTKMAGAGNDFIIIDAPPKGINLKKLAIDMCGRTEGIGADGLLILEKSKKADFKMRIINADGSSAEMCGNGARCMAAYIVKNKMTRKNQFTIETLAGIIKGEAKGEMARVTLSDPVDYRPKIALNINGRSLNVSYVNTGVPHTIIYVHELDKIDVASIAPSIRNHSKFKPRGTNVNFVEVLESNLIDCRTFERGVEDETRACGTGSVAAAVVSYLQASPDVKVKKNAKMKVKTKNGEILDVSFDKTDGQLHNVQLRGSAKFIAKGEYYV